MHPRACQSEGAVADHNNKFSMLQNQQFDKCRSSIAQNTQSRTNELHDIWYLSSFPTSNSFPKFSIRDGETNFDLFLRWDNERKSQNDEPNCSANPLKEILVAKFIAQTRNNSRLIP